MLGGNKAHFLTRNTCAMKTLLVLSALLTASLSLSAQTFGGFPNFDAKRYTQQTYSVPGDSSSAQQEEIIVEVILQDTTGIKGIQASFMPATAGALGQGANPLSVTNKPTTQVDYWRKGTKTNFEGYVVYLKIPAFQGHANSKLHVKLEGPNGQWSNAFIHQP